MKLFTAQIARNAFCCTVESGGNLFLSQFTLGFKVEILEIIRKLLNIFRVGYKGSRATTLHDSSVAYWRMV